MKQILLFFLVNLPLLVFSQFQETFDLFWYFRSFRRRLMDQTLHQEMLGKEICPILSLTKTVG